jgi:hypothetical protein
MSDQKGIKHDHGKPRMELVPAEGLELVAQVFSFGASKYGDYNWAGGLKVSRLVGAALRHIFAFLRGETNDPESGLPHLAHAGCGLLMAITMMVRKPEMDDRYKGDS